MFKDLASTSLSAIRKMVAELDPSMPFTQGQSAVNAGSIDFLIEEGVKPVYAFPSPDFDNLPEEAQLVIANMMFNLGRTRLSKFRKFIGAVRESDWNEAGNQMVDSLWYTQVTNRAARLVQRIRNLA